MLPADMFDFDPKKKGVNSSKPKTDVLNTMKFERPSSESEDSFCGR